MADFNIEQQRAIAIASARARAAAASPAEKPAEPAPEEQTGRLTQAITETAANMATGMIAKPVSDLAGLGAMAVDYVRGRGGIDPVAVKKRVQEALTYEPKTTVGKAVTEYNPVALLGKAVSAVSGAAGDAIRGDAAGDTLRGATGNLVEEALNQAPGLIGAKIGKAAEARLPRAQAALDIAKGENSMIDAARAKAMDNGYKVPAEGGVKGAVADLYGRAREARHLSAVNTENATRRIGSEIGLAPGEALSKDALDLKREAAHEKYQAMVDLSGAKLSSPTAIETFKGAVGKSLAEIDAMMTHDPEGYAGMKQPARLLRSWLKKDEFDTERTLQSIKDLRADAKGHFINNERYLATAKLGLANQLENLFEGHLAESGNAAAVQEFKSARRQLAKINFIDRVTNPETGRVDLAKIGNLSQTKAYKGALDGEIKNAADYAIGFKRGAQKVTEAPPQLSVFDGLFAAGALFAGHPMLAAGEIGSRLAAPVAIRSGLLQAKTPTYQAGRAAPVAIPAAALAAQSAAQQEAAKRRAEAAMAYGMEGRADGGPVNAGQPYVVGERGPEVIVPHQSGTVVPNIAEMGGGKYAVGPDLRDYMTMPFMADPAKPDNWREDGSLKGGGFLGSLKTPDGRTATEYSVGVNINGKDIDVPSLVPTLTRAEVQQTLAAAANGKFPPQSVIDKATEFAKQRMMSGLSVFAP